MTLWTLLKSRKTLVWLTGVTIALCLAYSFYFANYERDRKNNRAFSRTLNQSLPADNFSNGTSKISKPHPSGWVSPGVTGTGNSTVPRKVTELPGDPTTKGFQMIKGAIQAPSEEALNCQETPVVVCQNGKTENNSQHDSNDKNIHVIKEKNQIITKRIDTGETFMRLVPPIKIGVVNLPIWMKPQLIQAQQRIKGTCILDDGPITNEMQIVAAHGPHLVDRHKQPRRWPGQIYVIIGWETPPNYRSSLTAKTSAWHGAFNTTMSYRMDSDIFHPYSRLFFSPKPAAQLPNYAEIIAQKTKQVIWFVSNCRTASKREVYVNEMKKYINVDVFGACGKSMSCPWSVDLECVEKIILKYRFYLSFESSICPDYVTEKLFKVFADNKHIVPVVRGGAEYKLWLPANTYINAADFPSPKDLAMFLLNMDSDTYSNYLATKDLYSLRIEHERVFDGLCDAFTQRETKVSTSNVKQWLQNYKCAVTEDGAVSWSTSVTHLSKALIG